MLTNEMVHNCKLNLKLSIYWIKFLKKKKQNLILDASNMLNKLHVGKLNLNKLIINELIGWFFCCCC